jgi:UDPglucose--hexose-1-phosphate uridylyltransferase
MSELRHDPLSKRWVIIANERSRRPEDFGDGGDARPEGGFCPFCPGSEDKTPGEIVAIRPGGGRANGPGWEVRVIPNKYPALSIEGTLDRQGVGLYDRMRGVGAHEVVIESPQHALHMGEMDPGVLESVLALCQDRMRDLGRDARFKYVLLFKNHGAAAGATLSHPHLQLIATPVTPRAISVELDSAREHFHLKERCIFCDMLEQELQARDRVVTLDEHFAVLAPYASRFPFELMILPRRHNHAFTDESRAALGALSRALKETLARLKSVLRDPPYNFVMHSGPNTETLVRRRHYWDTLPFDFHWHIEILPRLTRVAGFEWGTGFYINPTAPEEAAAFLRDAVI